MIESIVKKPLQVYIIILLLSLSGLLALRKLPISLFPNSSKPTIVFNISYQGLTAAAFEFQYGKRLEAAIEKLKNGRTKVNEYVSIYGTTAYTMTVTYDWGADVDTAQQTTRMAIEGAVADMPNDMRRTMSIEGDGNQLTLISSFWSDSRTLDEVYKLLAPQILPKLNSIGDVASVDLFNPSQKEIQVVLNPEALQELQTSAADIERSIQNRLFGALGGEISTGSRLKQIRSKPEIRGAQDLKDMVFSSGKGYPTILSQVAQVQVGQSSGVTGMAKTGDRRSLMLLIFPKQGSNLRSLSDKSRAAIEEVMQSMPDDIKQMVVMDKSDNITASIKHVILEVGLGSFLATLVLYLFLGQIRSVVTAAIEIPISMILAFSLMYLFDININLFSLAGLALASGMNVDASVVVMDNIFRHLEAEKRKKNPRDAFFIVVEALNEVKWPIITSTIASLAVFIPFLLVDGLGKTLLGDLVKAVIFSHGFSAIVALILVPTVRIHLSHYFEFIPHHRVPASKLLVKVEGMLDSLFKKIRQRPKIALVILISSLLLSTAASTFLMPRLPREIIGRPDSEWILVIFSTQNHVTAKEMESVIEPYARDLKNMVGDDSQVSLTVIGDPNNGYIALRMKNAKVSEKYLQIFRKKFPNQSDIQIMVESWSQGEFSLRPPPAFLVNISGGEALERAQAGEELIRRVRGLNLVERLAVNPGFNQKDQIILTPKDTIWSGLGSVNPDLEKMRIIDELRLLSTGKWIGDLTIAKTKVPIRLKFPGGYIDSLVKLRGYPAQVASKVLPLDSLFDVERGLPEQAVMRRNGQDIHEVVGYLPVGAKQLSSKDLGAIESLMKEVAQESKAQEGSALSLSFQDPDPDLNQSVRQLSWALCTSIFLLFIIILLHFGALMDSLIVLLAVPFAIGGATLSLYVFQSQLSLNAILGMTLLCGIAVNNSIILVDFIRKMQREGHRIHEAVVLATKARLRPILITSITTVLGMTPIAIGFGEGGKVLSPLGISVVGGLLFSTTLTLVVIPAVEIYRGRKACEA